MGQAVMDVDYGALRVKMVDGQVRTTDVTGMAILEAMLSVPREPFVPSKRRSLAYIDEDILLSGDGGAGSRYLMEPSPFAKLLQLADIRPSDFILDVGGGNGYSAAVLSRLGSSVVALESDAALADNASSVLTSLGYDSVAVVKGPLNGGYPSQAPYDVIFVGGSVDELPKTLTDQLKDGGRLVVVEGRGHAGVARLYVKSGGVVSSRRGFNAAVQPLPGFERPSVFEF